MLSPLARTLALAAVVIALGAYTGRRLLDSANDPPAPVLAVLAAHADPPQAVPAIPRRVVLALLDGLGRDALDRLVTAGELGPIAWRAGVDTGTPSLSRPLYHVLLTGVPQAVAGVANNAHRGPARADTLTNRVRGAGGAVAWALDSVPWLHDLGGRDGERVLWGAAARDPRAFAALYDHGAALTVVHLSDVDHAGHAHGAASAEYQMAARTVVHAVRALRDAVAARPDAARTVWFVGADHGHLARGGHGGPEPAVTRITWYALMAGTAADAPALALPDDAPATALAATFAAALGVPPPREALAAALPLPGIAAVAPSPALEARGAAVTAALTAFQDQATRGALSRALGFIALIVLAAALAWRRGARGDVQGAALVLLGAAAGYAVLGPGFTLSAIRTKTAFIAHGVASLALGAALAAPLARRRGARGWTLLATSALSPLFSLAVTLGSTGRFAPGPTAALLLPASGLVPAGCALGVALGCALTARRAGAR